MPAPTGEFRMLLRSLSQTPSCGEFEVMLNRFVHGDRAVPRRDQLFKGIH